MYEKCDNAACFHNWRFLNYKLQVTKKLGFTLQRTDFNDPYSGKDQCDRDFAIVKTRFRNYINAGNNIETATDMKLALDTSVVPLKGIKYCVVELDRSGNKSKPMQVTAGIQRFYSFKYEVDRIRAWRYYKIGEGIVLEADTEGSFAEPNTSVNK